MILIFGAGGLSKAFAKEARAQGHEVAELTKEQCNASVNKEVRSRILAYKPDFIISCAGTSDLVPGVNLGQIVQDNLLTQMVVGCEAYKHKIPCLLLVSTAGLQHPKFHPFYGPAKAGVQAFVESMAKNGAKIWGLSPNRMDTKMRQRDWPDEDPNTRLDPRADVAPVMMDIINGHYAPGANVVIRKVGVSGRIDKFEAVNPWVNLPSML